MHHASHIRTRLRPLQAIESDRAWYAAAFADLFNTVVPEESLKWIFLEPTEGQWQNSTNYLYNMLNFTEVGDNGLVPV